MQRSNQNKSARILLDLSEDLEMQEFFFNLRELLQQGGIGKNAAEQSPSLDNVPGECVYLVDYKERSLPYTRGFKGLLGYDRQEVDFDFAFSGYHPDDEPLVTRIIKTALHHSVQPGQSSEDMVLMMTYRRRKRDGSYVQIFSQSTVYELDDNGCVSKSVTRLSDISFLTLQTPVNWTFHARSIDEEEFRNRVYLAFENPFTTRELEIIRGIQSGWTNEVIADKLSISPHTVATHRKNIFRKCDCHTPEELILYCRMYGILR